MFETVRLIITSAMTNILFVFVWKCTFFLRDKREFTQQMNAACVGDIVSICHDFKCLLFSLGLYQLAHLQTNINKPCYKAQAFINGHFLSQLLETRKASLSILLEITSQKRTSLIYVVFNTL